ncbi:hypothetical protein SETIT_9G529900v2 [Setaria italica]|uniref:Uncharacterized protein n=2 Tax=Setaria TaxID=4554 RepID=A0A368SVF8_SETIT|nr:hypothetical protein SETIT_9G529900v2 [Setaria italica]TKV98045.1 hypothetical protein SEVIR_9G534566v2 [Setaria viridis]
MAPTAAAMVVRATVVAVLLLMQCCNVILAARPLLLSAAADGRGWQQLGKGAGSALSTVRQLLAMAVGPGEGNPFDYQDPNYQPPDMSSLVP